MRIVALLICLVLAGLAGRAAAETADPVILTAAENYDLRDNVSYAMDATREVAIDSIVADTGALDFQPVGHADPSFGFREEAVWLRIRVENPTDARREMRLVMGTNFMTHMQVWQAHAGEAELVLDQTSRSPFQTRQIANPFLVAPVILAPQGETQIYVRYVSNGGTALPVSLQSPNRLTETAQHRAARLFLFYAIVAVLALGSLASFLALRRPIFLAYFAYATSVVLFLAHLDGATFQYLWPGLPVWNSYASLPLGCCVGASGALFARIFLETERTGQLGRWVLIVVMVGCCLLPLSPPLIGERMAKAVATLWVTLAACGFLIIGLRALLRGPTPRIWFFMLGWLGMVTASLFVSAKGFTDAPLGRDLSLDIIRLATVFDAFMMGMAVLMGLLEIRRERDQSLKQRLDQIDRNLSLHKRLNDLENRYGAAVEDAELRGRILSEASHDIRQPLFALRAAMHKLESSNGRFAISAEEVASSLDYLEALVEDLVQRSGIVRRRQAQPVRADSAPVSIVLNAIAGMFESRAAQGGVRLRVVPCSARMQGDAMAALRIVSNFVSNAIEHSGTGDVLVGCRRSGETLTFEVYDRGRGIEVGQLATVLDPANHGQSVSTSKSGNGLGLTIAAELAAREGNAIHARSTPGRGSCFCYTLTRADSPDAPPHLERQPEAQAHTV